MGRHSCFIQQESPPAWTQEAYRPPCSKSLAGGRGYLPWPGGTYLGRGDLPWPGGTYLGQGDLPWPGGTYLGRGCLSWLGLPTLAGRGVPTMAGLPPPPPPHKLLPSPILRMRAVTRGWGVWIATQNSEKFVITTQVLSSVYSTV